MLQSWFPGSNDLVLLATKTKLIENLQISTSFCVEWTQQRRARKLSFKRQDDSKERITLWE